MQLITPEYLAMNIDLHKRQKHYGNSGATFLDDVINLCKKYKTQSVLDYGCGKGALSDNLPFEIQNYDPAFVKYSTMPKPADIVHSSNVLEHIEPELLDNVLIHIKGLMLKVGLLVAATKPANKTLADGRNAHLIIENTAWWYNKMDQYFHIVETHSNEDITWFLIKHKGL